MKRLVVVLGGLLALPAFAEVAPFFYDDMAEYANVELTEDGVVVDDEFVAEEDTVSTPVVQKKPALQVKTSTRTASRVVPSATTTTNRTQNSRAVASRGTTNARTVNTTASRGTASRAVASRATQNTVTVSPRGTTNKATVARAATGQTSSGQTVKFVDDSVTYAGSGTYTGRVGVRGVSRVPTISVSSTGTTTSDAATIATTTAEMDSLTELTDYCKAQYTACMDNFCDVLDDNQGRCSCSRNLKNYEKTENALKAATEELQEVAQKIQYIGLTSDEITTLFTQTEAELAMQSTTDSTKLKNDLDRIKSMIVDVKTGTATATDNSGISLDLSNLLSFNIDSTGFDLSGLFGTTSSNTTSVSNQRGETLYKTATARCKATVLNSCVAQGVDAAVITNAYDLEIDKQCIAYERSLSDSNSQMSATVRNAKTVLQKARLMVAQQKNQYDLRGCISALDSCMQDDYVCGTDYEDCLDPSGKYIVEGSVVVGSMPGMSGGDFSTCSTTGGKTTCTDGTNKSARVGLYSTWNKGGVAGVGSNIWSPAEGSSYTMSTYLKDTLSDSSARTTTSNDMSIYLQNKIGYHDNSTGKNHGMCISILNKCQDYTYDKNGKYIANNSVIANYMERALQQIKAAQDTVLANYTSSCLSDVASCLSQNNYVFTVSASSNPSDMAIRACLPVINTCRSVTGEEVANVSSIDLSDVYKWLDAGISTNYEAQCIGTGGTWNSGVCDCSDNSHSTVDTAKRTCTCDSGYKLNAETKTCEANN